MGFLRFGPGVLSYTLGGGTAVDYAQEVKSVTINHAYNEVGEASTYLGGNSDVPGTIRADSLTANCDFDFTAAGFYSFLYTNDQATAGVIYTPSEDDGASWAGDVILRLPEGVSAESFGAKLSGAVTHSFVGPVAFTPTPELP